MKDNIRNNQSINSTMLYFAPNFSRRVPQPPHDPDAPRRFGFSMPKTYQMLKPCEILPDGRTRLYYDNPDAKEVSVVGGGGSFAGEYPMHRDEQGYWTVDLDVTPGIHVHRYRVDGVIVSNPIMPYCYCAGEPANFFETVDDDSAWYLMQDVPHGDLRMEYYRSSVTGRWKVCWVYTPAGYEANTDRSYPVLYLQHGAGEDETGWIDMGRVNLIMDNMIAAGECEEMLVVMNCGWSYRGEGDTAAGGDGFEQELLDDCIPLIETNYRVKTDRESSAMAGLSMGSFQAQRIVLNHLDRFAYLGAIITWINPQFCGEQTANVMADAKALNQKLKLFFASCGEQESQAGETRATMEQLKADGLEHAVYYSCPGYHELTVCRKSLRQMLPLLFK